MGSVSSGYRLDYQFPVMYYENNLAFNNKKECLAVYKIEGFTYDFLSERSKFSILNNLTRLFWNLGLQTQLKIIPKISSIFEDNELLKKTVKGNLKFRAIEEIDAETKDLIEQIGDLGNEYEFYMIVKLPRPKNFFKDIKEFGKSLIQDPVRLINKYAGLDDPEIFFREIEQYQNQEEVAYSRILKYLKIERIDEYITQRIIKQPFYFGIGNPPLRGEGTKIKHIRKDKSKVWKPQADIIEKNGEKILRPHMKDVLTLSEAAIDISHLRHLELYQFLNGKEIKVLQSYIIVSNIPDLTFPGDEWVYNLLSQVDFPISCSFRFDYLEYRASLSEVRKKQRELADQGENIEESSSAMPLDLLEQNEEVIKMEYDLKNRKYPLLNTSIIIGVSARDKQTLDKRIETVRGLLDDISTEVPCGDQWLLFNETLLGGERYSTDYLLKLTPEHLAGSMIGATKKLGDEIGSYIGITGLLKKPVRVDLSKPSRINRAPNVAFCGSQGGGKSFTADLLTCKHVKLGAKAIIIDPKGDRTFWKYDLSSFDDEVNVTNFSANENDRGKLDPFNIMRSGISKENYMERMREAANLSLDICLFLIAADRKDPRTRLLLTAVERVVNNPNPSMIAIINMLRTMSEEALEENDDIKRNMCNETADTLNSFRQFAYSSLLFGDGSEEAVSLDTQINILQIQNLVFPSEDTQPDNYTFQEIVGYACLLAITGYITMFIMGDTGTLKIFELDEATVINSTPVGKNTVNKLQRMARALNTPGLFISQSVDDYGDEKVRNNIGYKFCFKSTDEKEIKKILEFYRLEETEANKELISNLQNGVTLFQDLDGRVGIVAVDAIFDEYINAFDTRPQSKSFKAEMYLGGEVTI